MVSEEQQHEFTPENYAELITNLQNSNDEENEDQEDTLSLCDLPIYSDSDKWELEHVSSRSSSSFESDNGDEFFEFFTEDFTATLDENNINNNTHVVFCGKVIPYRTQCPKLPQSKNESENPITLMSSVMKPRWYLYVFGILRLPSEMGLREMKTRQSRRLRTTSSRRRRSRSFSMFTGLYDSEKEKTTKGNRTSKLKGLLGFLRLLGCRSRLATDVVGPVCKQC